MAHIEAYKYEYQVHKYVLESTYVECIRILEKPR